MKTFDASDRRRQQSSQALPRFDLEYLVDDIEEPSEVMIVPAGRRNRPDTEWIAADIRLAVPLEWVR